MLGQHLQVGGVDRSGGVWFHGCPTSGDASDFSGFMVSPGGFQGLRDGVGSSAESVQRFAADGEFDTPAHLAARIASVSGYAIAANDAALDQLGFYLAGLRTAGSLPLTLYLPGGEVLSGRGRVIDHSFLQARGGVPRAEYSLTVRMPDPYWYGKTLSFVSTGSNVDASHEGNTAAWPRFTVVATSNMTAGYQLIGAGRVFEVPGPLNVGQVDKVDFRAQTVRRNGVLVTGVKRRTWVLPGGGIVPWRLNPLSGAGSATMQPRNTFI